MFYNWDICSTLFLDLLFKGGVTLGDFNSKIIKMEEILKYSNKHTIVLSPFFLQKLVNENRRKFFCNIGFRLS
jgi:hypothetical protein